MCREITNPTVFSLDFERAPKNDAALPAIPYSH